MPNMTQEAETYLRETLHAPVRLEPWRDGEGLPAYLKGRYRFYEGTVGDARILFLRTDDEPTPTASEKHREALRTLWTGHTAFLLGSITARGRQRLISAGVPFVVPGNQVYLPMLGITLTERYKRRILTTDRLRPSAQLLLLHALTQREHTVNTASAAARLLGYTAMAMGQAVSQLEAAGLVRVRKMGRERTFELASDPEAIWESAQPLLASPVKRRLYAGARPLAHPAPIAGITALAEYSTLAEPRVEVVAISPVAANDLATDPGLGDQWTADDAAIQVELWSYAPELLSIDGRTVDRLSLFLSLRDDADERVQSALEEMMRDVKW